MNSSFYNNDERRFFIILDFTAKGEGKELKQILVNNENKNSHFLSKYLDIEYADLTKKHVKYQSNICFKHLLQSNMYSQVQTYRRVTHLENLERKILFSYLDTKQAQKLFCVVLEEGFTTENVISAFDLLDRYLKDGAKVMVVTKKEGKAYMTVQSRSYLNLNYLYIEYGMIGYNICSFLNIVKNLQYYKDAKGDIKTRSI